MHRYESLDQLSRRCRRLLERLVPSLLRGRCSCRCEADDVIQEVLLKVARFPVKFRQATSLSAYLWRVAFRAHMDMHRGRGARDNNWVSLESAERSRGGDLPSAPDVRIAAIQRWNELADDERRLLAEEAFSADKAEAKADRLGISPACYYQRVRRARGRLDRP